MQTSSRRPLPKTQLLLTNQSDREKLFAQYNIPYYEILPIEWDAEIALLQELGMPTPNSEFSRVFYPGHRYHKSFSNYLVEYTGILAEAIPDGGIRSPVTLDWTPDDKKDSPIHLNVWRMRVWEKSTAIHVYAIYNPIQDMTSPLSISIGAYGWITKIVNINSAPMNIEQQVKESQLAAKGLVMMRRVIKVSQTRGAEMAVEEFHRVAFEALPVMVAKGIKKLSHKRLEVIPKLFLR